MIDYLLSGTLPHNDMEARRVVTESEHYSLLDDTLFNLHRPRTKGKHRLTPVVQQLCLPRTLRDEVIKAYHNNNGHIGFDKLYETIRSKYFWPRMYAHLSEYVKSCKDCQETKRPVHNKKAPLISLPVEDVFSRFHLDFLGPLPPSNGFRYLLVAIDSTSLFPEIHPTKTCDADETAKVLYEQQNVGTVVFSLSSQIEAQTSVRLLSLPCVNYLKSNKFSLVVTTHKRTLTLKT